MAHAGAYTLWSTVSYKTFNIAFIAAQVPGVYKSILQHTALSAELMTTEVGCLGHH